MGKSIRKSVSDLGAGAYAMMHGFKVVGKQARSIVFELDDSEQTEFNQKLMEYLSSEFHRFDSCLMSLKKTNEFMPSSKHPQSLSDLGSAAYVMMHGYKTIGRQGKLIYFEVNENEVAEFEQRAMEYLSTEFHQFDSCLMSLKKINEYIPETVA